MKTISWKNINNKDVIMIKHQVDNHNVKLWHPFTVLYAGHYQILAMQLSSIDHNGKSYFGRLTLNEEQIIKHSHHSIINKDKIVLDYPGLEHLSMVDNKHLWRFNYDNLPNRVRLLDTLNDVDYQKILKSIPHKDWPKEFQDLLNNIL